MNAPDYFVPEKPAQAHGAPAYFVPDAAPGPKAGAQYAGEEFPPLKTDDAAPPAAPTPAAPTEGPSLWSKVAGYADKALTGLAHGLASGNGPISTLVKQSIVSPDEIEEVNKAYGDDPSMTSRVFSFVGDMYTPENAMIGQGIGTALGVGGKALASKVGPWMENLGINQGRRVLTGGANLLSVKKPLAKEAVEAAFDAGAIRPGRTTQFAADTLKAAKGAANKSLGQVVDALDAAGVKVEVEPLAQALEAKAADLAKHSIDSEAPGFYQKVAAELREKAVDGKIGFRQGEAIKQSVQRRIDYDALRKATDMVDARKDIASVLRQASEDAASAAAKADPAVSDLAAQFVPAKETAGNLIEASKIATKGAAQAARRNMFGLRSLIAGSGAGTAGAQAFGPLGALAGPATMVGTHVLETRGTPTAAWALHGMGGALEKFGQGNIGAGVSRGGPIVSTEVPAFLDLLGLRAGVAPAAADATRSTSAAEAPQPASRSTGPWRDDTPPAPGSAITGALEDPAQHFLRWMRDPNYRAANGSGGK